MQPLVASRSWERQKRRGSSHYGPDSAVRNVDRTARSSLFVIVPSAARGVRELNCVHDAHLRQEWVWAHHALSYRCLATAKGY